MSKLSALIFIAEVHKATDHHGLLVCTEEISAQTLNARIIQVAKIIPPGANRERSSLRSPCG